MNELTINNFETLKSELKKELISTAQSVCRIGYLLKLARDTDILGEGGYADVYDFAFAEYGLDKSQVSRFMNINDRFSIGGNSEQLLPEYADYGSSKLSIMLTLPDEINEELSPDMTKSDIQAIKEEYEEEQKITPLEHMAEDTSDVPDDFIAAVVKQLNDEHPEPSELMHESMEMADKFGLEVDEEDTKEYYMPDGDKTYIINVPGQGRFMIKCTDDRIVITSMATGEKSHLTWEEFTAAVKEDITHREFTVKRETDKPKEKTKPKKVERAKKPENTKAEAPKQKEESPKIKENEEQKPEENAQAAGAEESAPEENTHTGAAGEPTALEKQICDELGSIIKEIMDPDKTNWEHVTDKLRNTIHKINRATF